MLTLSIIKGCPSKAVIFDKEQSFVRPIQVNPESSAAVVLLLCVFERLCVMCVGCRLGNVCLCLWIRNMCWYTCVCVFVVCLCINSNCVTCVWIGSNYCASPCLNRHHRCSSVKVHNYWPDFTPTAYPLVISSLPTFSQWLHSLNSNFRVL